MSIKVEKLNWRDGTRENQLLVTQECAGKSVLNVGIATVPKGGRCPEDAFTTAGQNEVALILDGAFMLYEPDITRVAEAGDLISFPAGQLQAYKALSDSRLLFIHFGPKQD